MIRILSHSETLVYYDGPELFIAHDQLQLPYVCLLVHQEEGLDRYLCVPVSPGRLHQLLSAELDLRAIFETPETDEAFIGDVSDGHLAQIKLQPILLREVVEAWFPESGFLVTREAKPTGSALAESRERQRAIIHCSLDPPEAKEEAKITADHLGQAVKLLQRLVKHAYRKALEKVEPGTRRKIDRPQNYELEVFAFSAGSFTVHMQTVERADLLGYSEIAKAMSLLDLINEKVTDPQAAVEIVSKYRGHFATAYRDFLEFIVKNKTPIAYEWTMPERSDSTRRKVSSREAAPIYEALMQREELRTEEKRIIGVVTKGDQRSGTWRLYSEEERKEYRGKCDPASDVDLAGIVIGTQRYEFLCEEHFEEERGTGRESVVLYLKTYKPLA